MATVCEYNEKNKFYVKHDKQLSKEISQSPGLNNPAGFLLLFDLWLLRLFQWNVDVLTETAEFHKVPISITDLRYDTRLTEKNHLMT